MDDNLQNAYDEYFNLTAKLLDSYSAAAVAGIMVAQAMSLYKTTMSDEDYQAIAATIYAMRDRVRKFETPSLQ